MPATNAEFSFGATAEKESVATLDRSRAPIRLAELASIFGVVALCDLTIYNGEGFAGISLLFVAAPMLLFFGAFRRKADVSVWVTTPMLLILAMRLVWCGNALAVASGLVLLASLAMGLAGLRPYAFQVVAFMLQTVPAGLAALVHYVSSARFIPGVRLRLNWLAVVIPAAACFVFSGLFLLANPDLLHWVGELFSRAVRFANEWIFESAPAPTRIIFWLVATCIVSGLIRPLMQSTGQRTRDSSLPFAHTENDSPARLYEACRNTLAALVVLFGAYLAYEFTSVWSREFPPGSYSAYAHEGAFWLTVALAAATFLLSAIFQGSMISDPRLLTLRRWTRLWAIENFLLAVAVYHRMFIYVEFNGMTRMRIVGLLGISAVVVGFVLVLVKIAKQRSFLWLIRSDLWALGFFVYLYAVLPVDTLVMNYNVRRIMNGDLAPAVQIAVHPINSEGISVLAPLLDTPDELIREGVRAMLAERLDRLDSNDSQPWSAYQIADENLRRQLIQLSDQLEPYSDPARRKRAREAFHEYASQWY